MKRLARLKYPDEHPSAKSTTRLGDWYGTLIRLARRHLLLFISERSRLPVILPVRDADRLAAALPAAVSKALAAVGVPPTTVDHECSLMLPIGFAPTRSPSLLGSLNEFASLSRAHLITKPNDTLDVIAGDLAEVPLILPFNGESASVISRRLLGMIDHTAPACEPTILLSCGATRS